MNKEENLLLKESLWDRLGIWKPSFRSVAILSFLTLLFWFITRIKCFLGYHIAPLDTYTGFNLLDIHLGIGAILIPLALFTAESMLSGKSEKSEVLLDESLFFPLVVFEILTFVLFLGSPNILITIPVFLIGLFTIISFKNTIKVLLYPEQLEKKEKDLLIKKARSEFIKKLDQEINFRKQNNDLFEARKDDSTLSTNPFTFRSGEDNIKTVTSHKKGLIIDIDLKKINLVDEYITKRQKVSQEANAQNSDIANEDTVNKKPTNPLSNLKVLFGNTVSSGDDLYEINQDYFDELDFSKIEKMIQSAINIDESYDNDLASKYIRRLKDRCLNSIESEEIGELSKNLNIYIDILDSFYDYLNIHGGGFSEKQASEERGNFIGRLESLRWIHEDIIDIYEKGISAQHTKIIRDVAYLPIRMMRKAIENNDHLVFQEFLIFPNILYRKALELKTKTGSTNNSDFMIDRSWRYLKELSFFYIESERSDLSEENIESYGVSILKTFQSLLKTAIDNGDVSSFGIFMSQVEELFNGLEREYRYDQEEKDNVYERLDLKRNQMIFGVASWLLFLSRKESDNEKLTQLYSIAQNKLPQNIEKLSVVFNSVHSFEVEDFWGWNHWESSLYTEGKVHTIQILEKLEVLFAVKGLHLLRGKNDTEIEKMKLDPSRDLVHLTEGSRSLISTLDSIESSPEDWEFILNKGATDKVGAFKTLLLRAKESQEEKEAQVKRDTSISHKKVTDFKVNLVENYKKNFPISELFKFYNLYSNKTDTSSETHAIGINTLFDKAAFFGKEVGWYVHYSGDDEAFGFGRSMAQGENKKIFNELRGLCVKEDQGTFDKIFKDNNPNDYIILTTNNAVWRYFEYGKDNYIPKWRQDFPDDYKDIRVDGVFLVNKIHIPVFSFFIPDNKKSEVYIINKNKFGSFTHWKPENKDVELSGVFSIEVLPLDQDSPETVKLLSNPPGWLEEIDGEDARLKYLQERLVIKVFEKFEYIKSADFEGYIVKVEKE